MNRMVVAGLTAMMVAGCSTSPGPAAPGGPAASTSTTPAQAAPQGVEAKIETVPWSQVGPGWMLATWSPVPGSESGMEPPPGDPTQQTETTTLFLVDPEGGRYPITTFPPPGDGAVPDLVDWSGDGSRVLLYSSGPEDGTVIEVDLHSGKQTTFTVDNGFDISPRYTRPEGKAVLLVKPNDINGPASLTRVDLAGKPQLTYAVGELDGKFNASYISSSDGTQLVLGTDSGLALMGNDGTPGKALPVAEVADCTPMRWWGEGSILAVARCYGPDYSYSRLWLVPIDGAAPTALTAPNSGQDGNNVGEENAWSLPSDTFVQALGPCGYKYLATVGDDGTTTPVSVPNVDEHSSVVVLGTNGQDLALQASMSCGGGQSLLTYDAAAETSTVLLGPPVNGGAVIDAVAYPGQQ